MESFRSLVILCGFVVLQSYAQDAGKMQLNLPTEGSNESTSDDSRMRMSRSAQPNAMQEQYQIISLCTNIPSAYNDVINMYVSSENTVQFQDLQNRIDNLKSQSQQLSKSVDTYTAALNQPETYPVRTQMISSSETLMQALEKLRTNLNNEPQLDVGERVAFASSNIRPALVDFQTACLAETKDIVNNVLSELRDNSNVAD